MNKFFLVDKSSGITSFDLLRQMRKILGVRRIGHIGTLDPLATGCMLVATGDYTKCIPLLEGQDKTYIADIMLDGTSASYDIDTEIVYVSSEKQQHFSTNLSFENIDVCLKKNFLGVIEQIPPKYSALKIRGKRALDRTLAGEDVIMKKRRIEVHQAKILSYTYPLVQVEFCVSSGTYIRSLAHDLGQILGSGGYLSGLRRTSIGNISISQSLSLEDLHAGEYSGVSFSNLFGESLVYFDDENVYDRLSHGQRVRGDFGFPKHKNILLFDGKNIRFMIEYIGGVVHPRKKICSC